MSGSGPADTIVHRLFANAVRRPGDPALVRLERGQRRVIDWRQYADLVRRGARALIAAGLPAQGVVAIVSANRCEWLLADLAVMAAGGLPTGVYPTSTAEQVAYILRHSRAPFAIVENAGQLEKIRAQRDELPGLERAFLLDGKVAPADSAWVERWDDFLARLGGDTSGAAEALASRLLELRPEGLGTLIYTSGTTGEPKGVMLTHRNLTFTADATRALLPEGFEASVLSYLPMSHIAEQMISLHLGVSVAGVISFGSGPETLRDDLLSVRPTFFFGVPRVWEKLEFALGDRFRQTRGAKRRLLAFARRAALDAQDARSEQRSFGPWVRLRLALARRLVFDRLKAAMGLDRVEIFVSGAAPIAPSTLRFFASLDILIREVYGLSETSGPSTFNGMAVYRPGTVGPSMPGVQVRVAADGEVLLRGESIFAGYLHDPQATAEVLSDGWFKTGDVGSLDAQGFLRITDRKKDLLITAGGKNVAPQPLEQKLAAIPEIAQAVVLGDREKYLAALLAIQPTACERWAKEQGIAWAGLEELAADARFRTYVESRVEKINSKLAGYETIKRFELLPRELSLELGELTPTLKVKRRVVQELHAPLVARLFGPL